MKLYLLQALVALPFLASCDFPGSKFEIVRSGNQTYLLNKQTGDSKLIDGTTLVDMRSTEFSSPEVAKAKAWPAQKLPGVGQVSLAINTKYRDGTMLYVVTASPYEGSLAKAATQSSGVADINFTLYDVDSFEIGQAVELPLSSGLRVIDDKGKPTAMRWAGSRGMSSATYREAAVVSFGWKNFPPETKSE